jgi:hypothetical protein
MNKENRQRISLHLMMVGAMCFIVSLVAREDSPHVAFCSLVSALIFYGASTILSFRNIMELRRERGPFKLPKIIGWTHYNENYRTYDSDNRSPIEWANAEQAVVNEIRRKKYKFGGNYHQYGLYGCPVFDDHTVFMVSMRHWGDIMSRVWGGDYCSYAWEDDMGRVPSKKADGAMMSAKEIEARENERKKIREEWEKNRQEKKNSVDNDD